MILHTLFVCTGPSRCNQPVVVGECEALIPSWFYNSTSGECERFDYGGCGGNDNRFSNRRVCQAVCNDDSKGHCMHICTCFPDINTFTFISLLPPSHTQTRTHHSQAAQMEFLESHVLQIHVTPKTVMLMEPSVLQTSVDHVMLCG